MHLQHFRLNEKPFSTSLDPRYFYLSTQHREALAKAEYAVTEKLGLAVVSGDIGMEKTTVSRLLLQKFRDEYKFNAVILTHPAYPTENQLLRAICQEFRIGRSAKAKLDLENLFKSYLIEQWQTNQTPVLIIDEAQTMRPPLLEQLRQILNFETNKEKLIKVVLFGQIELLDRLTRKPNFKSRVSVYGALTSLTLQDAIDMLSFRYRVAGGTDLPFTPQALEAVYRYAKGVPRAACIICDNALLKTFLRGQTLVSPEIIEEVAAELGADDTPSQPQRRKVGRPSKAGKEVVHAETL